MIVQDRLLDVCPITDRVLHAVSGAYETEVEMGALAWSNELVLHVIELKTNGPVDVLDGLAEMFHRDLQRIGDILRPMDACLMPTAAHPWMDPHSETRLWPHEQNAVYEAFDRIFSCRGHGWSNLQSIHVNLPFADDAEFGRLHAAIRVLLPIIPALAAASPFLDGKATPFLDARLDAYRHNADRIPSITGHIIPERVYTRAAYEREILDRIYRDVAPHDPRGVLRHEWVNARGAIARFDRHAIEIRLPDMQECPASDMAVVHAMVETLKRLCDERWTPMIELMAWDERELERILLDTIREGEQALIGDEAYAAVFGMRAPLTAGALWAGITQQIPPPQDEAVGRALRHIVTHGTLAGRLKKELGETPSRNRLHGIYSSLCDDLMQGRLYSERV